ncbi:MAG: transposase [Planctomycetes bacterium]|nr:transposase [Planctomycetota bacterium]
MAKRARFDDGVKKQALADLAAGMTLAEVADKYGASIGSIQNWKKKVIGPASSGGSPHARLQEITKMLADLENEKVSIQRRLRSEQAIPRIKEILLKLSEADLKKLDLAVPALGEQARFLRDL